jgi:thioredoxin:protein disulfide reductase
MPRTSVLFFVMLVVFQAMCALAETPVLEDPLVITSAQFSPIVAGPGATTELQIKVEIVNQYKAYTDMFKLRANTPANLKVDKLRVAPTHKFDDPFSKRVREAVEGVATIRSTVELPNDVVNGDQEFVVNFTYQACTKDHCNFPKTIPVKARIQITNSHIVGQAAPPAAQQKISAAPFEEAPKISNENAFSRAQERGVIAMFIFVFIAGLLTSLTPCIYPLIPITLAVIGARREQSRLKSFSLSVLYVLGIATTYSLLGVGAASTGALFGAALSNIYIVTGIAVLFVLMGLSMYGLYEVQAPAFVRARLGNTQTGTGFKGAYLSGLISGVVASPCIGPVLVTILTWIAQTGNKALGFGLLFTFALGIGVLLIFVGTFSHVLSRLPKSGPWMEAVKFIFGTTMVAMALYYIYPLYPRWLFYVLVSAAMVSIASVYGAFEPIKNSSPTQKIRKGLMLALLVMGFVFGASGVALKMGLFTNDYLLASKSETSLPFQKYSEQLIQEAKAAGKPVMIDFYADWCVACKELEVFTFTNPEVEKILREKFILIRVDATSESAELDNLKTKYGIVGLPTIIFYDHTGTLRPDLTVTGFEDAKTFLNRISAI